MAALQAQLALYSQAANGQNAQAKADYKSLQSAITSGNLSQAQAALTKLQRDSKAAASNPTTPAAASPADSDGDNDGSGGPSSVEGSLDTTA